MMEWVDTLCKICEFTIAEDTIAEDTIAEDDGKCYGCYNNWNLWPIIKQPNFIFLILMG